MKSAIVAALSALLCPLPSIAQEQVSVLSISNGQQLLLQVNGQGRALRLACLQAPRARQQPWSDRAERTMNTLVKPGDAALFELRARDVHGRLVGRLLVNGMDIGAELVRRGAVFPWDGFIGRCDDLDYEALAAEAEQARIGVWSVDGGLKRPWDVMEQDGDGAP